MPARDPVGQEQPPAAKQRGSAQRYARLGAYLTLLGVALLVVGFVLQELRTRDSNGGSGVTVANYKAVAKVDNRPAPAFEMPSIDGSRQIAFSDFSGKIVVLNFWASWCGPCRREAPGLEATSAAYRNRGVQFLGVDYRDDRAAARAFVDEFGITYPSVTDDAGKLAFEYGLVGLPTTFIIDGHGQIVYRFIGYTDATLLKTALDDVLRTEGG